MLARRPLPVGLVVAFGLFAASGVAAQAPDLQSVARNLVQAGMVKPGDKVWISGSVRDAALMEHVAVEVMKVGAFPLLTIGSEQLTRRSYDEVPAALDTLTSAVDLALINTFDVFIPIDVGETENALAGVPEQRRAARAKAAQPVTEAFFRRPLRFVNLGNGLYPTASLARRLGIAQVDLAAVFWKAAGVPAAALRARGDALRAAFGNARQVTVTHPNGTNITFGVELARAFTSDGAITPEKAAQGTAAASTYLPAGEFIVPAAGGSANGRIVFDKVIWDGQEIRGLTLTFQAGRLTAMTAASAMEGLRARYDAGGAGKDQFGYLDIGVNPEATFPVGSGHVVWGAPGSVVLGFGDNRIFGGTNASDFGFGGQLGGATVKVDGRTVVENGRLR